MPPPTALPSARRLLAESSGVGVALLALYLATRSANLALAHDTLFYLADAASGDARRLFHPHHLAYPSALAGWLALAGGAEPAAGGAALSAVAGAATGATAYALLRLRAGAGIAVALGGTLGAALSFGFWFYSASVEVYLLPMPALLGALLVISGGPPGPASGGRTAAAGVLLGLAVLGHEAHALFGVPLVALVASRSGALPALRAAGVLAAVAGAIVLPAYAAVLAFVVCPETGADAVAWAGGYAAGGRYWAAPGLLTLAKASASLARSVTGLHAALAVPAFLEAAASTFSASTVADESYLVRRLSAWAGLVVTAGAGLAWALLAVLLVGGWRRAVQRSPLVVALGVWVAVYAAFFSVWDPQNVEFWIPQATALWLLAAGLAAATPRRASAGVLAAAAALTAAVNGWGSVGPASRPEGDACRHRLGPLVGVAAPGDVIVVEARVHLVPYCARYLTGADGVEASDPAAVRQAVRRARTRGGRVFVVPGP